MIVKTKLILLSAVCFLFVGSSAAQQNCTEDGSIKRIVKARSGNFETVTFEFNGIEAPTPEVKTVRPPFEDYGGNRVRVSGRYFKSVNFRSVNWTCRIRESLRAATTNVAGVKNTEQFEGHVEYIVGYRKRSSYVGSSSFRSGKLHKVVLKFRR